MPLPGVDHTITFKSLGVELTYSIDLFIVSVMMVRIYHLFRLFGNITRWKSGLVTRYCVFNNVEATTLYALKAESKTNPYVIIGVWVGITTLFFGTYIRLFERVDPEGPFDHNWNGPWVAFLTMSTIGYGEIYPTTHMGRFFAIFSCVLGSALLSMFVVALENLTRFTSIEKDPHEELTKTFNREGKLGKEAVILIQRWWKLKYARRHQIDEGRFNKLRLLLMQGMKFRVVARMFQFEPEIQQIIDDFLVTHHERFKFIKHKSLDWKRAVYPTTQLFAAASQIVDTSEAMKSLSIQMLNLTYGMRVNKRVHPITGFDAIRTDSCLVDIQRRRNRGKMRAEMEKKGVEQNTINAKLRRKSALENFLDQVQIQNIKQLKQRDKPQKKGLIDQIRLEKQQTLQKSGDEEEAEEQPQIPMFQQLIAKSLSPDQKPRKSQARSSSYMIPAQAAAQPRRSSIIRTYLQEKQPTVPGNIGEYTSQLIPGNNATLSSRRKIKNQIRPF